uniref:(northern house mosquito) hypothetical protein n=1 Tax=Culex pipiens TaxID=7175 RepID=A0A8D8L6T8_CULPI
MKDWNGYCCGAAGSGIGRPCARTTGPPTDPGPRSSGICSVPESAFTAGAVIAAVPAPFCPASARIRTRSSLSFFRAWPCWFSPALTGLIPELCPYWSCNS